MVKGLDVRGRRFLVTGGTSGIGAEIVRQLIEAEAHVAFCGLTDEGAAALRVRAEGACYFEAFDLTDLTRTRSFAQNAIDALGGLDGLVNNAGTNFFRGVVGSSQADVQRCFDLNFYPAWALAQEVYASLKASQGIVVTISSIHAEKTVAGSFPYNASKAALSALTRSLALEWGANGIRAVEVAPALILTPLADAFFEAQADPQGERDRLGKDHPVGHAGRPEDVASLVLYLLGGGNTFISGTTITVDGGISARL